MIFHENCLLADDSHEISYLIFLKIKKDIAKFFVCCSRNWRFKGSDEMLFRHNVMDRKYECREEGEKRAGLLRVSKTEVLYQK